MESDNMEVVETMKNGTVSHGIAAAIFDDCYHLSRQFVKIQFVHVFREANTIAHELARLARGSPQCAWIEDPPNSIIPLMLSDATLISNE
jgi:hypothetical protein